jgi:histone H3/H4
MNLPDDASLERITHLAGVTSIDDDICDYLRELIRRFLKKVIVDASAVSEYRYFLSIDQDDVIYALQAMGYPVLSTGNDNLLRQCEPWHQGIEPDDYAGDEDFTADASDEDMTEADSDATDDSGTSEGAHTTSGSEDDEEEADGDGDEGEEEEQAEEQQQEEEGGEENSSDDDQQEEEEEESLAKIGYYQSQSDCVFMDRVSFCQVAREVTVSEHRPELSARAMATLQVAVEMFLAETLANALLCVLRAGRHVVAAEDLRLVLHIKAYRWFRIP